jgi:hypothetical protein
LFIPRPSILLSNPKASELLGKSESQLKGKKQITDPDWKLLMKNASELINILLTKF